MKRTKPLMIAVIIIISVSQYLCFLGMGLNSSSEHDDLFMFIRSSQYVNNYNLAVETELPRQKLPDTLNNREFFKKRFNISESHWKTYIMSSSLYNIPVLFNDVIKKDNSAVNYSFRLSSMLVISFLFSFSLFIVIISKLNKKMILYVLTTMFVSTFLFFIATAFHIPKYDAHLIGAGKGFIDFIVRIPTLLFRPMYQYHFLSFTPRNQFTLMLFITFILRWNEQYKLSYWFLFVGFLFHAGMGVIFFLFICMIDLIRKILFNQNNFNIIVIFLIPLLFVVRSDLLFVLLSKYSFSGMQLLPIILLFIAFAYVVKYLIYKISSTKIFSGNRLSIMHDSITGDLILFFCVWIAGLPFVVFFNSMADSFSSTYLWSQLLGRPLAMMHGPLLLALVIYIYGLIEKSNILSKHYHTIIWKKILPTGFYLILIVWFSAGVYAFNRGYSTFSDLINEFAWRIDEPFTLFEDDQKIEAFLLYTSIRSFDDGKDYFQQILPQDPNEHQR